MKTLSIPVTVLLVAALLVASLPFSALAQTNETERGDRATKSLPVERDSDSRGQVALDSDTESESEDHAGQTGLQVAEVLSGRGQTPTFFKDEIIVKFTDNSRPSRVKTRGQRVSDMIAEYRDRNDVEYAEPNYIAYAHAVPNDPYYDPYQWNFDNDTYGGVHAETAWDVTDGSGVVVAVIDTGVAYENYNGGWFERYSRAPDLKGTSFVAGYDFVNNDTHANDDAGHGTHVAGTIAGTSNDNTGVAGLAYGATIMPIKVLASNGSGSYADVADGIRFAVDNGAKVINLSLGGSVGASYLEDAVCYAKSKGVTVVASSGNDGANTVSYPAAYDNCVIAVGATRFDERITDYSNKGTSLDLVAPGGDTSVDQNGDGYGDGILQQTFGSNPTSFGYYFYQGTSMAAPHVSAAAAMVIAAGKASTPAEVQSLLESTADDLGASGFDTTYGYGLINLEAALTGNTPPPEPPVEPPVEPPTEPVNVAPTADAGADQTVDDADNSGAEVVTLDGSGSSDSDGSIVLYEWYEGTDYLGSGATLNVEFAVGTHVVTLGVVDNGGASSTDEVVVTVDAYEPPPPPPPASTELFYEGFEDGLDRWTQDSQGDWRGRSRVSYVGRSATEVDGSANDALLISPNFSLGSGADVRVSFAWFIEDKFDSGEYIAFDVSTDGGTTWTEKARLSGNVDQEEVWHTEAVTISNVPGIQIRFRAKVSSSIEDGYVDEVLIETL